MSVLNGLVGWTSLDAVTDDITRVISAWYLPIAGGGAVNHEKEHDGVTGIGHASTSQVSAWWLPVRLSV